MTGKNRYFRRSKISKARFRQIVRYFALDLIAMEYVVLTSISVRSANDIYLRIRRCMNQ